MDGGGVAARDPRPYIHAYIYIYIYNFDLPDIPKILSGTKLSIFGRGGIPVPWGLEHIGGLELIIRQGSP